MDVHRVHAYVLESLGEYALAIEAYDRAIAITPNLTFLYLRAGAGYRRLAFEIQNEEVQKQVVRKIAGIFRADRPHQPAVGCARPRCPTSRLPKLIHRWASSSSPSATYRKPSSSSPPTRSFMASWACSITRTATMKRVSSRWDVPSMAALPNNPVTGAAGADQRRPRPNVKALPLSASTVYYYDVYASELAALSTSKVNYCPQALDLVDFVHHREIHLHRRPQHRRRYGSGALHLFVLTSDEGQRLNLHAGDGDSNCYEPRRRRMCQAPDRADTVDCQSHLRRGSPPGRVGKQI